MGKTLLQRLEKEAENLIHAAGNIPYRVKKATVGTSLRTEFNQGRRALIHQAKQRTKGVAQELEGMFEDVVKNVKHFEREWHKHPERLQNRARRFMSEGVGFLETTAEYLQNESPRISKNLMHKIGEAINIVKHALQTVMKYFSNLLENFLSPTSALHTKQTTQVAKKGTHIMHSVKSAALHERPRPR